MKKSEEAENRYVGDLNVLTFSAFDCNLQTALNESFTEKQIEKFESYLDDFFNTDIPVAYIVGFEYFLNLKILVTKDTLIPRFETEELVINLEKKIRNKYKLGSIISICDVCTGSGVIAVSLHERLKSDYKLEITAIDLSEKALKVASQNFESYNIDADIFCGNLLDPVINKGQKFDIVVSNPPYIGRNEDVQSTVLKYEPELALYAEDNGLALYKEIIDKYKLVTNGRYSLMFEIGEAQSAALNKYINDKYGIKFETIKDINGLDRNLYVEEWWQ